MLAQGRAVAPERRDYDTISAADVELDDGIARRLEVLARSRLAAQHPEQDLVSQLARLTQMLRLGLSPWRPGDPDSSLMCDQRPWRSEAAKLLSELHQEPRSAPPELSSATSGDVPPTRDGRVDPPAATED
jgi:hypothetical protein